MSADPSWKEPHDCRDCGAKPGETHMIGCDVERCPACKGHVLSCDCGWDGEDPPPLPWTGIWPGKLEAEAKGWFSVMTDEGYCSCKADHPEASPDLNRYAIYTRMGADQGPTIHSIQGWNPTAIDHKTMFELQDAGRYYPGGKGRPRAPQAPQTPSKHSKRSIADMMRRDMRRALSLSSRMLFFSDKRDDLFLGDAIGKACMYVGLKPGNTVLFAADEFDKAWVPGRIVEKSLTSVLLTTEEGPTHCAWECIRFPWAGWEEDIG